MKVRKRIRNTVSCMAIITLFFTMAPLQTFAVAGTDEDPSNSIVEMEEESLDAGEPEMIPIESLDDDEDYLETGGDKYITSEDSDSLINSDDEELGAGTESFIEGPVIEVPEGVSNIQPDDEYLGASSPGIYVSSSNLTVAQGSVSKVTITISNFSGGKIGAATTNGSAYSAKWDAQWNGNSIGLNISGLRSGSGSIKVYLENKAGTQVAARTLSVTVACYAKLSASASSASLKKGERKTVKFTYSNYCGTIYLSVAKTNTSTVSTQWGSWSGKTIPLTITGSNAGSVTIRVSLIDSNTKEVLKTVSLPVFVSDNPIIKASTSSLTVSSGSYVPVTFTVSGAVGKVNLKYNNTNTYAYDCNWSGYSDNKVMCSIAGKNAGSGNLTLYLCNDSGQKLTSATVGITVKANKTPSVKMSQTSVELAPGNATQLTATVANTDSKLRITFSRSNKNIIDCKWGTWKSGSNQVPLTITGKNAGSCRVDISLFNRETEQKLADTAVQVNVRANNTASVQKLSYSFPNFGSVVPLDICKYMYGNTARAQTIYESGIGNGGNCFGMSTSAGLLYVNGSGVSVNSFGSGKSLISQLDLTNKSSVFRNQYAKTNSAALSVKDFIQAMQIAQCGAGLNQIYLSNGELGKLISVVQQQALAGYPVKISAPSPSGSRHAVLAYGVEKVNSNKYRLLLYDSNHPFETRYLNISSRSPGSYAWDFEFSGKNTWSSSKTGQQLNYCTYTEYKSLWNRRGSLSKSNNNMLTSNSDNLKLFDIEGSLIATVVDGALVSAKEGVQMIDIEAEEENEKNQNNWCLMLPIDLYTVKNTDPSVKSFGVNIVDEELGIQLNCKEDEVTVCADDSCNLASVLLEPKENDEYQIALCSSREGDPEKMEWEGVGTGDMISAMLDDGNLETCNLSSADYSVGSTNEASQPLQYMIAGETDGNGTISCGEADFVTEGKSATYQIIPNKGYQIQEVKIDGVSAGAVDQYTFKRVHRNHVISVTFTAVSPDKPIATSIRKVQKTKRAFTVDWVKKPDVAGYQIQYSLSKSFKKSKKTVTVKGVNKTTYKAKGLKAKKTYYIRVRTYKNTDAGTLYSTWSKTKSIKTK